ncbi:HpcH/HpaI aldolase/citrate lyase family protein [Nitrosophilus kaiyonis]|uniref:HpcH/HpaI aldolase/citrate lyase family protein n=1 Tax=Nitrosophilus kaiyonis TaxID=2930200 RepID=UPI002492C5E0|nr:aldolase/citrate lyase family protein [Nitrosophilus kaiyonis]
MVFDEKSINILEEAIKNRNSNSLDSFIMPVKRIKNRKINIKSALMVSAHQVKHMNKLDSLDADIAIINLEDGVSKELKPIALKMAAVFLSNIKSSNSMLVVRINPLDEGGIEEIEFLNRFKPDAIRVPKIRSKNDVKKALRYIDKDIDIHLSIETKEAFLNIEKLKIDDRIKVFYLGILDLLSDLNIYQDILKISNPTIDFILSKFLIETKSIDVFPISFVYQDYKNLEEFERWCIYEKDMGFEAKGCISPKQVEIANRIFSPSIEIIKKAKYIKDIFEKMSKEDITGFKDEKYGFIDEPIYKDALNILKKYS